MYGMPKTPAVLTLTPRQLQNFFFRALIVNA